METRFSPLLASYPPSHTFSAEEPENACRANAGAEGASSRPQPEARETGTGGTSATLGTPPKSEPGPWCTFSILGALADCVEAAITRNRAQTIKCVASSGAAVECLLQKLEKK